MNVAWIRNLALTGICVGMIGCGSYRTVYSTMDKSVDFSQYRTFAWAPDTVRDESKIPDNLAFDNDIVRNNAKNYITNNLTKRGLLVNVDSPDFVLQLVLLNERKEKIVTHYNRTHPYMGYYFHSPFYFPYYYPYYRYYTWYGWSYPPAWEEATTYTKTYVRGTVIVKMIDRSEQKLVWMGTAEGDIYDPSYIHYNVHPAIDRIMKLFPVKDVSKQKRNGVKDKSPIVRTNDISTFRNGYSSK